MIHRREFITLLGGAAAWPLAVRAQQGDPVRRIGVLLGGVERSDPLANPNFSAFTRALAGLGWADGRNMRMDLRWYRDAQPRPDVGECSLPPPKRKALDSSTSE